MTWSGHVRGVASPARFIASNQRVDNFGVPDIVRYNEVGVPDVEFSKSFYSPHEVAAIAGVHPSTILNYIASGRLYAVKLSERTYRIPVRAVIGLLEPERLTPSAITVEPEADVAHELAREHEVETVSA
jgi:excisionase family DNA binding protein